MSEDQPTPEAGRRPGPPRPDEVPTEAATSAEAMANGATTTGVSAPDEAPGPEPEGTGFVQVHRRRAPRYRAFVVTGLVVAFVVSAAVAVVTPPSDGYSQQALFGYLFVALGVVGSLLGGLAAILVERRSGRVERGSGRRSRSRR